MSNTQHKLDKARPPRVQITYDLETGGAGSKKELPLVIGVIGDFFSDKETLRYRKFLQIDKDNFNDIMKGVSPSLTLTVNNELSVDKADLLQVELTFKSIDDFSPESIAMQVAPLKKLIELREQLSDLRNRAASNDRLKDGLTDILLKPDNIKTNDNKDE